MMHDWFGWGGGWASGMWLGPLFMVLIFVLFVVGVVALLRWIGGRDSTSTATPAAPSSARDILDQRFARGEIDADDYRARRHALEQ
jgi:putative membrane protein